MKIEIKRISEDGKIMQVTTTDERFYTFDGGKTWKASSSWIASYYPKGIGFYKWLAKTGWDEAEEIKVSKGNKGSKVHKATEDLDNGKEVRMDDKYPNSSTGELEELTVEEWECIISYSDWHKKVTPEIIQNEIVVYNSKEEYAGTLDRICRIDGVLYIIDLKTSPYIWKEHEIQISAYKHCDYYYDVKEGLIKLPIEEEPRLAILQLGYKKNKAGYKFTEIEDKFDLFLSAKKIWKEEEGNKQPHQKDYPVTIKL